jgi:meiotically up-regulated gene 157 (Mug157) protein
MLLFFNLVCAIIAICVVGQSIPAARPDYDKRSFHSKAIDNLIDQLTPLFKDPNLATLFSNTLPNTLDTTVYYYTPDAQSVSTADLDSFVITGDINALWLRDSMNQVMPYIPYVKEDTALQALMEGLINRHAKSVLIDSFANAFNFNASGDGHQHDIRTPPMKKTVFEGKYEIDSLCAFLKLSYWYWQYMDDETLMKFASSDWIRAVNSALDTIQIMQVDDGKSDNTPYAFQRTTSNALDTLMLRGHGPPAHPNGLSRSLFRPSDDAVTLPYNIPGNAMACVEITHVQSMLQSLIRHTEPGLSTALFTDTLKKADSIGTTLCDALRTYTTPAETTNTAIPYEIDGYEAKYFMDDANIPSLLSLPFLGYFAPNHPNYLATRSFVLSSANPFYFTGSVAHGVGGPHVGYEYVWPMSIIMRAMTSSDEQEIADCLATLLNTTAGKGLMHESFNVNNANNYTRDWFAWANGLFGELMLQLIQTHPSLILQNDPKIIAQAQKLVQPTVSYKAQKKAIIQ